MKTIKVDLFIEYDEEINEVVYCNISGRHTIEEMSAVVATFKKCLKDWGYDVTRNDK